MRIMTWNIRKSTPAGVLLPGLKAMVDEQKPDIVCLQEDKRFDLNHPGENIPRKIAQVLGMNYVFSLHPIPYGLWWEGLGIYSRLPLLNRRRRVLDGFRAYITVSVHPEGLPELTIACIHLANNRLRPAEHRRLLRQLPRERIVLAGDFNDAPDEPEVQSIANLFHHDDCPDPTGGFLDHNPRKIDYIWASQDLSISDAHVPKSDLSDHNPLVAAISLSKL
jgi:endonuclease/exonuclease/phosphatase family metal-dependent hydrolase